MRLPTQVDPDPDFLGEILSEPEKWMDEDLNSQPLDLFQMV